MAVKADQLLNLSPSRRQEERKSWVLQKVCAPARTLVRTRNGTGKQKVSFFRPKKAFGVEVEKVVFFDMKENAIFPSFSCLRR